MNKRVITLTMGSIAAGFAVGFMWGKKTRDATPGNITTQISGGVLTVKVDAGSAVKQGFDGLFG